MISDILYKRVSKNHRFHMVMFALIGYGCGSSEKSDTIEEKQHGLEKGFIPPVSSFNQPELPDPFFNKLNTLLEEPYWVSALTMDRGEIDIGLILTENSNTIKFHFPENPDDRKISTIKNFVRPNNDERKIKLISEQLIQKRKSLLKKSKLRS